MPRRTGRPSWFDLRIIGGVLLVVAAVVIGAKVVGASSHTTAVWSATHELAQGTVLTGADVAVVQVNLGETAGRYLSAEPGADPVSGRSLAAPVRAGELLPVSAVQAPRPGRVIVVGVAADRMPPGVGHGSVIDLYLTTASAGAAGAQAATTERVSSGITVQSVAAPATGGLSGATSNRYQVAVLLDAATADTLVRTLPRGEATVVLVSG